MEAALSSEVARQLRRHRLEVAQLPPEASTAEQREQMWANRMHEYGWRSSTEPSSPQDWHVRELAVVRAHATNIAARLEISEARAAAAEAELT